MTDFGIEYDTFCSVDNEVTTEPCKSDNKIYVYLKFKKKLDMLVAITISN